MVFLLTLLLTLSLTLTQHAVAGFDKAHESWTGVLSNTVKVEGSASRVNYQKLKSKPEALLSYLNSLSGLTAQEYDSFNKHDKLAFLINAYNAFTLKLIVDHYPVDSIKDIGSIFTSAWKKKFFELLGEKRHLDSIEHEIIRKKFDEPRIHFALVCASVGCPALAEQAYRGDHLERQLEHAAKRFLTDKSRNRYDPNGKKLEISSIFKWYGDDFKKKYGSYRAFVAPRMTNEPKEQVEIREGKIELEFLDYDWYLNDAKEETGQPAG